MKWQGREGSNNIEDRRGEGVPGGGFGGGPFARGGGMRIPIGRRGGAGGLIGIAILLVICLVLGINPLVLLDNGSMEGPYTGGYTQTLPPPAQTADQQQLVNFVSVVVKDTENFWTGWFDKQGRSYTPPKVVLFSDATQSGCGVAEAASGPFYCPDDRKVYLDLTFYNQLRRQFGAPGDFAQAYVVAHEVGHHVQNLLGILPKVEAARQNMSPDQANAVSVRLELQADCYAGAWANYEGKEKFLDNGDTQEAINAANQIGDDTLQQAAGMPAQPRTYTHGSSAQRMKWFQVGLNSGDPAACDTFSKPV
ncbi:MAG TPA: neutral zinc metallopeptidase [Devosiaceae bacterium]|nr:neutral zinc metallopeptidase [Devosiaceae bacterium]